MTRASKEIYLNVDKLDTLPDADLARLEAEDRLLLQTEYEHVNVPLGTLREFVSGDFEVRADGLEVRVEYLEANGGGGSGGSDKNVVYEQVNPQAVWTINHFMGKTPSVTIIDSAGSLVQGAVSYPDPANTVVIEFAGAMAGKAILN